MAPCYPIIQITTYRSNVHPPLALGSEPSSLDSLRNISLKSDRYLEQAMEYLGDYYHKVTSWIPITFLGRVVVQIQISWNVNAQVSPVTKEPIAMSTQKEETSKLPKLGHLNVGDVLLILSDITLHTNKLVEKICDDGSEVSKKMQDLRALRKKLIDLAYMVDQILQFYKHNSGAKPAIEELRITKNAALELMKTKKKEFIHKNFGDSVDFSYEELALAALGLNSSTARELANIDEEFRGHQTDLYYLKEILCHRIHLIEEETNDVIEILTKSGFTEARARLLYNDINKHDLLQHQSLTYWVELYLDHMFQYDIFLKKDCPAFPHDMPLNEWFVKETERENEEDEDAPCWLLKVSCINTTMNEARNLVNLELAVPSPEVQEGLWYHGTDHDSAENIRLSGVDLSNGRQMQDFSHGNGFYLTPFYNFALKWACKKGHDDKCAVVVFKHNINAGLYKGLDLKDNDALWSQVVKYNRSGRNKKVYNFPARLKRRLQKVDFIDGHMSGDVTRCNNNPSWEPSKKLGDEAVQVCILSQDLADKFCNSIQAIIFFRNSINDIQAWQR